MKEISRQYTNLIIGCMSLFHLLGGPGKVLTFIFVPNIKLEKLRSFNVYICPQYLQLYTKIISLLPVAVCSQ